MIAKRFYFALIVASLFGLVLSSGGCASSGGSSARPAAREAEIPADSPLARIEKGMSDLDVRKAIGEPDDANMYMTGKAWIPFYYGSDTLRTDWKYSGQGRVVFSRNRYTGALKVVRVIYNPEEP